MVAGAAAYALPGPPLYNPVLKIVQGNQPLIQSYDLTITAPSMLGNGATFPVTIHLGKQIIIDLSSGQPVKPSGVSDADALSFLQLSDSVLTFSYPGQQLITKVTVNVPAGSYAGDYGWTIKGLDWPGITDLGAQVNATVLPPPDTTKLLPVVNISAPANGQIFEYRGGDPVRFDINFSATVAAGGQPLTFLRVFFDGVGRDYTLTAGAIGTLSATGTAASPDLRDGGVHTIQVAAQNTTGGDVQTIQINVYAPPVIVTQPDSLTRYVGDGATLGVDVRATPNAALQWQKNGQPIGGATNSTLSFASVTLDDAANYTVVATNAYGTVTSSPGTLTVLKRPQTITFDALSGRAYGDPAFDLTATASSGLAVSYTSSDPTVATVSGNTVTVVGIGTTTITATQDGNDRYLAATPVARELVVTKGTPRLAWLTPASIVYPTPVSNTQLNAVEVNNLAGLLSYSVSSGTILDAGTYTLRADFVPADSAHYVSVFATVVLVVTPAPQTITFASIPDKFVNDGPFTLVASASSGLGIDFTVAPAGVITLNGTTATIVGSGNVTVTATQGGNRNYSAATPASRTFTVKPRTVNISGLAFFDANGSDQYEAASGDFGLGGVAVQLRDGATIRSKRTEIDGTFVFTDVAPGKTYTVVIGVPGPAGMMATTPTELTVTVGTTDATSVNAGFELNLDAVRGMTAGGYTIGYWKNNLSKAIAGRATGTQQTFASLWCDTDEIRQGPKIAPGDPFGDLVTLSNTGAQVTDGMKAAATIMSSTASDPVSLLKKQLLASEYNYANGVNGGYINGSEPLTRAFIAWGECVLANASRYSATTLIWVKDWFDAYNNSHGGLVAGPAPLGGTSIAASFNSTAIGSGSCVWFNAVVNVGSRSGRAATIDFTRSTVQFTVAGESVSLDVPDGQIVFDAAATTATTEYDEANDVWRTRVPASFTGDVFLTGCTLKLPAGVSLPGGINPVTWNGRFTSATTGLSAKWSWAAAAYAAFNDLYDALGVKPIDGDKLNAYKNGDNAGTPEACKTSVVAGARGSGGSNYTGSYSGSDTVSVPQP